MEKATSGSGWAFSPAIEKRKAFWNGKSEKVDMREQEAKAFKFGAGLCLVLGIVFAGFGAVILLFVFLPLAAFLFFYSEKNAQPDPKEWQLVPNDRGLNYFENEAGAGFSELASWSVSFDEINRVETGKANEWETQRKYGDVTLKVPDKEIIVFVFSNDGRRLVVHTANAAREDCGRLAHSIRSYVDAQRGNAAPSPSDTSSPAADGFDL